jgi:hypothetical protein
LSLKSFIEFLSQMRSSLSVPMKKLSPYVIPGRTPRGPMKWFNS